MSGKCGREEGGRYSDDIQGWVSGLVGEDYDAFLLSFVTLIIYF